MSHRPRLLKKLTRSRELWAAVRKRRAIILSARKWLRPGLYLLRSEALWARYGTEVPRHLQRTKGGSSSEVAKIFSATSLLHLCAGTFAVMGRDSSVTAELAVASFDGGIVVLDESRRRVLRTYGSGDIGKDDQRWRRTFTDYVSAPDFRVIDDGAVIEEEYVAGNHVADMLLAEREGVVATLFAQYSDLTSAAGELQSGITSRELSGLVESWGPPDLVARWQGAFTDWITESTPWIPSAIEANLKNLIVRPDGRPAPIDLGDLRLEPYFVYPVGILIASGPATVERFISGHTDFGFGALADAAGIPWLGTAEQRIGVLLTRMAYAAVRDAEGTERLNLQIFSASLNRRWQELREIIEVEGRGASAFR